MLFHSPVFALFLAAVLILYFALRGKQLVALLVLASCVFYGWLEPKYTLLLLASSVIDYYVASYFSRFETPRVRNAGLLLSASFNFGVLFYFKYSDFALHNLALCLKAVHVSFAYNPLSVALPLGISFYTFHSFSYSVDVLKNRTPPCPSLGHFMLFVAWFPQLVAGPIARAGQLLPELHRLEENKVGFPERLPLAVRLFAEGWLRKASADWLALTANTFFSSDHSSVGGLAAIWGIAAFSLQIYGDFCGYTRMAQGVSWLFGVRLAENFHLPYLASGPQDFWRRWHMSLSSWFRDYLYIPLGGNRVGAVRTYCNLAITFLLCGLWHGATWQYIIWGGLHGSLLILERVFRRYWETLGLYVRIPVMWFLIGLSWVPFRTPNMGSVGGVYRAIFRGGHWCSPTPPFVVGFSGLLLCDVLEYYRRRKGDTWCMDIGYFRASLWVTACVVTWALDFVCWRTQGSSFIYFQF